MERHAIIHDNPTVEHEPRSRIVLVQHGLLVGEYGSHQHDEADRAAARLALGGGYHVAVYEVDAGLPPIPPLGTPVDPRELHWEILAYRRSSHEKGDVV